jgi:hypothetical protein
MPNSNFFLLDEQWYVESGNIIVRLNGTEGHEDAVLINAHYGKFNNRKHNILTPFV